MNKLLVVLLMMMLPAWSSGEATPNLPAKIDPAIFSHLEWRNVGPAQPSGRTVDLAVVESEPSTVYAATATGGLWKTVNDGTTWTPVWEGGGSIALGAVALAPSNPNVVYIGTGEAWNARISSYGDGVYRSSDGGRTWTHIGLEQSLYIGRIVVHPEDENAVYVAALGSLWGPNEERGLFKSTDGGENWAKVLYVDEHTGVVDVAMDPVDPDTVFAATYTRERRAWNFIGGGPEAGLFKSTDGGQTWAELTTGLPEVDLGRIGISICRSRPNRIYLAVEAQGNAGGIFRSEDCGASWESRTGKWTTRLDYGQIRCDPNDADRIYLMHVLLSRSEDGGKTFHTDVFGPGGHADWRTLWINPHNSDHVIAGSDGGVYFSYDAGHSWRFASNLPVSQFYDVAFDMQEPFYYVYGGLQDNGSFGGPSGTRYADGITNADWTLTTGGDGFYVQIDPHDPTVVYSEWQYGTLHRFDTRTGERKHIQPQPTEGEDYRWNWSTPLVLSKHDPKTLYFAANVLFRSRDRGDSWDIVSPDLTRELDPFSLPVMGKVWPHDAVAYHAGTADYGSVSTISESSLRQGLLAVGTDDGVVQVTTDDGASWFQIETIPGVPERARVSRVLLSQHDEQTLYATFDAHNENDFRPYVMKSTDLGKSWSSITHNLPPFGHARTVAEHPRNPALLFVGTELGVFVSWTGGEDWIPLQNNLPTVNVYDIEIHPRENDLVVATHGRGIWIMDDIAILDEMTPEILGKSAHLARLRPATQLHTYERTSSSVGTDTFSAPNPPNGAIVTYYVNPKSKNPEGPGGPESDDAPEVETVVLDPNGDVVRKLESPRGTGVQRVVWDLRHPLPYKVDPAEAASSYQPSPRGPFVEPGEYRVRLRQGDTEMVQPLTVRGDPAISITAEDRRLWRDTLLSLAQMDAAAQGALTTASEAAHQLAGIREALEAQAEVPAEVREKTEELSEAILAILGGLRGRRVADVAEQPKMPPLARQVRQLYLSIEGATARPTADQLRLTGECKEQLRSEVERLNRLVGQSIPGLNQELDRLGIRWTRGRPLDVRE